MIPTLNFLQLLQDNNLGVLDEDLFWQELALGETGVYIADIGAPITRGSRITYNFEMYARGEDKVDGYQRLQAILAFMYQIYSTTCTLPPVPKYDALAVPKATIKPLSTITTVGLDAEDRNIYSISGQIIT